MSEVAVCPKCDGKGSFMVYGGSMHDPQPEGIQSCTYCHGTGRVTYLSDEEAH